VEISAARLFASALSQSLGKSQHARAITLSQQSNQRPLKVPSNASLPQVLSVCACIGLSSLGTQAFAQFNPASIIVDLTAQAQSRSTTVTTTIAPACTIRAPQLNVSVAANLPAAAVSGVDTGAAVLDFTCNTPLALLSISSSGALLNSAPAPTGRDATKFTTRLPFSARADLLVSGQSSGTSTIIISDNSAIGPTNLAIGAGSGQRLRNVAVSARGITSDGRIPVAGLYTGSICVSVDPAGLASTPFCGSNPANIITVEP
jgi:hypothetical protein